jgi:hypothetical protein
MHSRVRLGLLFTIGILAGVIGLGVDHFRAERRERVKQDKGQQREREQVRADIGLVEAGRTLESTAAEASRRSAYRSMHDVSQAQAESATAAPIPAPRLAAVGEGIEQAPKNEADYADAVDVSFYAEDSDPAWSRGAEKLTISALTSALPSASKIGAVECRTTLCRMESVHRDLDAYGAYVEAAFASRDRELWNGGFATFITERTGAEVRVVSFFAREGHAVTIPQADGSNSEVAVTSDGRN